MQGGAEYSVRKVRAKNFMATPSFNHAHQIQCRHAHLRVCNIKNHTFSALASMLMQLMDSKACRQVAS